MASLSFAIRRLPSVSTSRSFCTCAPRLAKKAISSSPSFKDPSIPPPRKHVKKSRGPVPQTELFLGLEGVAPISRRPTLINEDSARELVRAWGIDKMHDATVLDIYPGELLPASPSASHSCSRRAQVREESLARCSSCPTSIRSLLSRRRSVISLSCR
jgi:hypothetical protein